MSTLQNCGGKHKETVIHLFSRLDFCIVLHISNLNEDLNILGEYSKKLVDANRTEIDIPDIVRHDQKEQFNNEIINFQKTPKNSRITQESVPNSPKGKESILHQDVVNFKSFQILKVIGAGAFGKIFLVLFL